MSRSVRLALLLIGVSTAAQAQEAAGPRWDLSGDLGVVSDFRFRGVSLSDRGAAAQGGATLSHARGAYANIWASTIDEYGVGAGGKGATLEVDLALGWAGTAAGLDLDVAAARYGYPGGEGVDYWELPVTAGRAFGPLRATAGFAYAPPQDALGDEDNHYVSGDLELAPDHWPFRVGVQAGYERGAFAPGGKWDWSVRLSRAMGPVEVAVSYVDTDQRDRLTSSGAVLSLIASF